MWQQFSLASTIVLVFAWFSFGQQVSFTNDSMDMIKAQVQSNAVILLDVREQDEWDAAHVKQAVLLPMSQARDDAKCAEALARLDKSKPIYCHCMKGFRAKAFAEMVQEMGFDVRPMKQPFTEIVESGLEIIIESPPE